MIEERPTKFGTLLGHYLKVKALSQRGLSIRARVDRAYISSLVSGKKTHPSLQVVLALINGLRLDNAQKMDLLSALNYLDSNDRTNESFSLYIIQLEHREWVQYNFPNADKIDPVLGVCEEAGELAHAALKMKQNIRGTEQEHRDEIEDAIGDIMIYLLDVCNKYGFNIETVLQNTWDTVKKRDWQKNTRTGQVS